MRDFLEELANKKMQEKFAETKQTENIVEGMLSTCETCGKAFESFRRGRMIIYKKCKDCIKDGIMKTKTKNAEVIQPEPQVAIPAEEERKLVPEIPVPAKNALKSIWTDMLFHNESKLLERLEKEAKEERRELKQHILYILEKRFEDF